ncbi:SAM-dependent methyltransferase [Cryptosporangium aurantiacum]|uniref:S-adenosyl methyltransferase n=1 Tax=Cryptosporangium aurantiacum TaxID=134849 RepID=A0A1M7RD23_9ACTN|nr:SAM-dependent methyltransferase [Cryptosporangium aurantiacum]SHN44215.1 S-adenosyl methyltransferase [Cryptosporangium aurantiacum]
MADADWMTAAAAEAVDRDPVDLRTDLPHPARVYDYLLGGKDNFPADRAVAENGRRENPASDVAPGANRDWLRRTVTHLTAELGIRQFLDIGTGLPTSPNVHEVAQAIDPAVRVVYTDNDPIVLTHARALLASAPEGVTDYLDADFRNPQQILEAAKRTLDFDQPIGLLLIAIAHFVGDADEPHRVVRELIDALPSGSYLALSHLTGDFLPEQWKKVEEMYAARGVTMQVRPKSEVERFFDGLELVEPGLTLVHRWRPDEKDRFADRSDALVSVYGAVARKP